eukprot:CAMPEP_0118863458 /NCGR_PEP_ID=MMETSP1163-20130328/8325_1 /TAXON_ID=124430 /ORGANISM="Phaeomonas parva, Strain CCMP2877" /LENGTH=160 /DNA_ID=CAMNT_0006797465 /DNA_START=15 /DNA_END=494 /DNA_ORIENTATION=-
MTDKEPLLGRNRSGTYTSDGRRSFGFIKGFFSPTGNRNFAARDNSFTSEPRHARRPSRRKYQNPNSPIGLEASLRNHVTEPSMRWDLDNSARILDRSAVFHQSRGTWNIERLMTQRAWTTLYVEDWYHTILNSPTRRILIGLVILFMILIFAFALLFRII